MSVKSIVPPNSFRYCILSSNQYIVKFNVVVKGDLCTKGAVASLLIDQVDLK